MKALRFKTLHIHQAPGVDGVDGLDYRKEAFSPGINILFGPNGSGKSTTARCLHHILFGEVKPGQGLQMSWSLSVGEVEEVGNLPAGQGAGRHLAPHLMGKNFCLSMEDLLELGQGDVSERIRSEIFGGVRFEELQSTLKRPTAVQSLLKPHQELKARFEDLLAEQSSVVALEKEILREQDTFEVLEKERRDLVWFKAMAELEQVKIKSEVLVKTLEGVDRRLLNLSREDRKSLRANLERVEILTRELEELEKREEHLRVALPKEIPVKEEIENFEEDLGQWRQAKEELRRMDEEIAEIEGRLRSQRQNLESIWKVGEAPPATLEELPEDIRGAIQALMTARDEEERSRIRVEAWARGGGDAGDRVEIKPFLEGQRLLRKWLLSSDGIERNLWPVLIGSGGTLVLAVVSCLQVGPWALIAPLPMLALLGWQLMGEKREGVGRRELQVGYEDLGLEQPEHWEEKDVEALIGKLEAEGSESRSQAREGERYVLESESLSQRIQEREARELNCQALLKKLTPAQSSNIKLPGLWLEAVVRAHELVVELDGKKERMVRARENCERIVEPLGRLTGVEGEDLDLEGWRRHLRKLKETQEGGVELLRLGKKDIPRLKLEIENFKDQIARSCTRIELEPEENIKEFLDTWEHRLGDCLPSLEEEVNLGKRTVELESELGKKDLPALDLEELERRLQAGEGLEERRDEQMRKVQVLESKLVDLRADKRLMEADRQVQESGQKIEERVQAMVRHRVASGLLDLVQQRCQAKASPTLSRASELMSIFTGDSYRLEWARGEEGEAGALICRRAGSSASHNISTLSSGTRIQMLLALRVAYLENQEGDGPKLPLFLDEVLGNSDDERAEAMVQALASLAKDRQVFYLTAQTDEVRRWRQVEGDEISLEVKVIAVPPGKDRQVEPIIFVKKDEETPLMPLDEEGHSEYGKRIDVPRWNPLRRGVGALHPWFLIRELGLLSEMLLHGLDEWGKVKNREGRAGENGLVAMLSQWGGLEVRLAKASERWLEELRSLWLVGRGKPLSTGDLLELWAQRGPKTGPEILALLESDEVDGQVKKLLEKLGEGAIKGFGKSRVENLAEQLEEAGFLDPRSTLGNEELSKRGEELLLDLRAEFSMEEWLELKSRCHALMCLLVELK